MRRSRSIPRRVLDGNDLARKLIDLTHRRTPRMLAMA
jgi:hypothetical protein